MDVFTPGGINTVVRNLAIEFARKGHDVVIFSQSIGRKNITCF